jgi:uncharacterized membrane protein
MARAKIFFTAIVITYPIIVYFGLEFFEARMIALALIILALARLFMVRRLKFLTAGMPQTYLVIATLLLVGISATASNSPILLQYYPVCLNVLMLVLFAISLIRPPSIIEQIARANDPDLRPAAIPYTRKVTMVWCGFFAFNGTVALFTVLDTSLDFWAIYNGFISYCLMGLLIGGEIIIRRHLGHGRARQSRGTGCAKT